ncbi:MULTISPECIES: N-acetylglucosamine kinase [unclassified Arthrobacter]|uniref:N-acetylglucosamine kinase n=1 Tax=unclassified Arthrobacter TaxID=235627 RepID=UPI001D1540BC|nr:MULTISPECIES: BadF/BadG/BcrA/BcrD ATPase family protein [unclassified Arthrobacter]MCC3276165.1 ATPase [Arthrobacter sp. zg-Y20]MCC9176249.1 ATPase [Arthrobacter sp. zg-Y750]MDK1316325.1 BadF/BadG/BcrA/BcrD ATPase family protein [Arthrobacter sp. zg.Y20]WIB05398.1 BadF/BadG/BcrA/BcrD ATPase family protein [Arthrobacter sp. zg-Y20]
MHVLPSTNPADGIAIGLDIGGTKTHGIRLQDGTVTAEARTGSANVQNVSVDAARAALAEIFAQLGTDGVETVVAGSGGVDTPGDEAALRALIAEHVPDAVVRVIHDTRLILAAGEAAEGIAVIAGTGSVAWGINASGRQARSGGWGYLLGDEGSGYWVGREAVRHVLRHSDLERTPDALTNALLPACGVAEPAELIGKFHGSTDRRYWAGKAGLVFEAARAGDPAAADIVHAAAEYLAGTILDVARLLKTAGPVVIGGGLGTHQPLLQDLLRDRLSAAGLTDIRFLSGDPVFGVAYLLANQARSTGAES